MDGDVETSAGRRSGPAGEALDSSRHRALGTTARAEIMRMVQASEGGLTAAEVAARTGQHLSTTRTHLERLASAGLLVKARASGGQPGRPAWRFRTLGENPAPAPAPYRSLAAALLDQLAGDRGDVRAAAAKAGEVWGRKLAASATPEPRPVDVVLSVLRVLGFDPVLAEPAPATADEAATTGQSGSDASGQAEGVNPAGDQGQIEVHLRTCPFLELVGRNPDAMCGLHLGVIRGVLAHSGVRQSGATLEPFGAPTACVARLPRSAGNPSAREQQ